MHFMETDDVFYQQQHAVVIKRLVTILITNVTKDNEYWIATVLLFTAVVHNDFHKPIPLEITTVDYQMVTIDSY